MADLNDVILTSSEVAKKRRELEQLDRDLRAKQLERAKLNQWLEAATVIMGSLPDPAADDGVEEPTNDEDVVSVGSPSESMMDAVVRITKEARKPLPKAELKEMLRDAGFEESRLGNYFYTVIKRLKDKEKINIRKDGSIEEFGVGLFK